MSDEFEQKLLREARALAADHELAPEISRRLAAARRHAVAQAAVRRLGWLPAPWVPSVAYAATLMFALVVWDSVVLPPLPAASDPLEFAAAQDADLLDDLEFVAWMDEGGEVDGDVDNDAQG